jgi:hypothetical protein
MRRAKPAWHNAENLIKARDEAGGEEQCAIIKGKTTSREAAAMTKAKPA